MVTFCPKHPKWDQNLRMYTPRRDDEHPRHFYMGTLMPFHRFSRSLRQCSFQRTPYLVGKMRTVWLCMVSTPLSWGLAFNRVLKSWRGKGSRLFLQNELQNGRTVPCKVILLVSLGQFGYFLSKFSVTIRLFHATNSAVLKERCIF